MCLYPTLIDNPKYKSNKKNGGAIPLCHDERVKLVPIGCGKCEECRRKKSGEWRIRLEQEFIHNKEKCRFITLTFNEEALKKYIELAREEINNKKKEDTKNGYDIRNIACKIAIRRWLERIRKDKKKSVRHWIITELGGGHSKRIHMHGFIWTNEEDSLKYWKNGYTYEGEYMSINAITYTTKYMMKVNPREPEYVPKILSSAGIGKDWEDSVNAKRAKYIPGETKEEYITNQGQIRGIPIYYRNKIYTEEEREKLWVEKLDKGERWIGGSKIRRRNYNSDEEFEEACTKLLEEKRREAKGRNNIEVSDYSRDLYREKLKVLRINNKEIKEISWEDKFDAMIKGIESKKKVKPVGCFMGVPPLYPLAIYDNENSENTTDNKDNKYNHNNTF